MAKHLKIQTKSIEPMILANSVHDLSFFMKIRKYLDTNSQPNKTYFNDEKNQEIFNLYSKFFDKYQKQPKKKTFLALLDKLEQDEEIRIYKKSIVEQMYSTSSADIDSEYIEEETLEFIKENNVYEAMALAQQDVESGNYGAIVSKMENAVRVSFDKDFGVEVDEVDLALEKINKINQVSAISTGYKHLDNLLDGGFHPKELTVLAATPGIGKTMLMGNIGLNAYLDGKNVLVYTFETSVERLLMRYYTNLTNYIKTEIILDQEGFRKKLEAVKSQTDGRLIIKEYNSNEVSSNDLIAHINDLKMYKNFVPDLIIVDYILIMLANDRRLSSENSYKYYKTVSEELRNIGKTFYVPLLTASQIGREGMSERGGTKSFISGKEVSESKGIYDTADIFIPIIQTARDKEKSKLYLYGDKLRNDSTGWKIEYNVDYDHMKITEGALIA